MDTRKVVPFTEVEWKYVQNKFMSDDFDELKLNCSIMNMWICRMSHDTPIFIGISELVLRAYLLEQKFQMQKASEGGNNDALLDTADVGLVYGSVIIRFVNYVNEICQPGLGKLSIAHAVSKMDIPAWIVQIRHQATHAQMPPMNMMKEAIIFCRKWLWRKYWQYCLTDAIKQTVPGMFQQDQQQQRNTMERRMVNALAKFLEWRKCYPNIDDFHPLGQQYQSASLSRCRISIESLLDHNPVEFTSFFVRTCLAQVQLDGDEPDVFSKASSSAEQILQGTLFGTDKYIDEILHAEQKYYRPIFTLMNAKGCLPGLLVEITRAIAAKSNSDDSSLAFCSYRHLAGWAEILLVAYFITPDKISTQNWRLILKNLVLAPQFYKEENIIRLLDTLNDNLSQECRRRLMKLLKLRDPGLDCAPGTSKRGRESMDVSTYSVQSLGDLQNRIRREEVADDTFDHDPLTLEADWSIAPASELGELGLTANQKAETLCLALGCDLYTY